MPPQDPNAQPMSEQAPGTNMTSAGPQMPSYSQLLEDLMKRQQNLTGMTQMAPAGTATPPASRQTSPGQPQRVQQFGVGGRGAAQRQDAQNVAIGAHNLAQQIGQRVEAKKLRDFTQVTDNFMKTVAGLNQAQAQIQDAQKKLQDNPQDQQAQQQLQQAQQALQQNQTNLEDMVHDSKKHKIITKAFGIDDKNAGSPERQAAIASIRKTQGVGQESANVLSRLPQTQQLSPEAQAQASAVKAGVVGKPQTLNPNKVLETGQKEIGQQRSEAGKDSRSHAMLGVKAQMNGMNLNPDGTTTPMTPEEIQKRPILQSKLNMTKAKQDLAEAQKALDDAKRKAIPEQLKMAEARVATAQGNLMMRGKEFTIKVAEEERKQLETAGKLGGTIVKTKEGDIDIAGVTGGRPLQSWAQQAIAQSMPTLRELKGLRDKLEPLKGNDQIGYLAADRLWYAMGGGSPQGELAAQISNIELERVIGAARILHGSSRSLAALQLGMIHTPDAWKDSPQQMYNKLTTMINNIQDVVDDSIRYGGKGMTTGQAEQKVKSEDTKDEGPTFDQFQELLNNAPGAAPAAPK